MTDSLLPPALTAPLFSSIAMRAIVSDRARLQRMLDFEAALARAEAAVGVIPASAAGDIASACHAERYDIAALSEAAVAAGDLTGPVVAALTAEVAKRNKESADYVHWGAASQDLIDTALALELRDAIDVLIADLDRAVKAFTAQAARHRRTMMLARAGQQRALPMPFGLKVAGYAAALGRSRERLRRVRRDALALQLGGTGGAQAVLGEQGIEVSGRLAALVDLPHPDAPWHDHRDRLADVAATLAILAGSCGTIAAEVALLMQSELGPSQNRHPLAAARCALSAAAMAPGLASNILATPIQDHERGLGGGQSEAMSFAALLLLTSGALQAVVDIAEGLEINVDRVKANLEASGGMIFAEAVLYALAAKLGRAQAQTLTDELLRKALDENQPLQQVMAADERITAQLDAATLDRLFTAANYQASAQTLLDRLVASSLSRFTRRSTDPAPRAPETKTNAAPTGEPLKVEPTLPTNVPPTTPIPGPPPSATESPPPASDLPAAEIAAPVVVETPAAAAAPANQPGALIEAFARVAEPTATDELMAKPAVERENKPE